MSYNPLANMGPMLPEWNIRDYVLVYNVKVNFDINQDSLM